MKRKHLLSSAVLAVLLAVPLPAEAADLPLVIEDGFKAYRERGWEACLDTWLKGGPLEGNAELKAQMSMFGAIETLLGKYEGYDLVKIVDFSGSTSQVYLILRYEKGPVFMTFTVYTSTQGPIISFFNFHTQAEQVWPAPLLAGQQ